MLKTHEVLVARDVSGLVVCLPSVRKALTPSPAPIKLRVVAHACNSSTFEAEPGESEVQGHSQLYENCSRQARGTQDSAKKKKQRQEVLVTAVAL